MKITTAKQLASYLQDCRQQQSASQAHLAKKVGVRQGTISNFEQNPNSTKLETLFKLLSALELELEVQPRNTNAGASQEANSSNSQWDQEW
ncbi:type II toxin-antitoxin system antitoxin HipB [Ferrimonas senticii]|uniref:type II toxin-antitoxin system antitoxin HipB n=1 Tax=Ferrimonas senticii TaxID=394566 RepID=UPI0003F9397C|nr:type II toxin-antitoxin system antitoxin HipB [Ferrimonas senticii]